MQQGDFMGSIYRLHCESCGYDEQFHLGSGLMSINPRFLKKCLIPSDAFEVERLESDGIKQIIGISELVESCECTREKLLYDKMTVRATDKNGDIRIVGCECEICGRPLNVLDINNTIPCPRCGCTLEADAVGHWD